MLQPIVASRRDEPQDDLISVLVEAEITDEDGTHRLFATPRSTRSPCCCSRPGPARHGSSWGSRWPRFSQRPEVLEDVRDDRELLRNAIEESVRWMPTDPMFSRWVTEDIDFHGVHLPKGSVMHLCIGAANRDPGRWERPDEYDIHRPIKPTLAFGGGPHVCLGMHVRAGRDGGRDRWHSSTAFRASALDPDAEAPRPVGVLRAWRHGDPGGVG